MSLQMFENLKQGRDITSYNLFHGTTDWSILEQFDLYEQGFPYLIVLEIPVFMKNLAKSGSTNIRTLINNYVHILEYEFTGLQSGLEAMSAEPQEISNGLQSMNVITKTTAQSASTFSMTYKERSGSILTRTHELYLRCVRDPATGLKHYGGLITNTGYEQDVTGNATYDIDAADAGFDKECFTFLYMHTDNTGLLLERAALLVGCMPTSAQLDIYNGTRGDVTFQDVSCEFTGFPIMGEEIDKKAQIILNYMNNKAANLNARIHRNSWTYEWDATKSTDEAVSAANGGTLYRAASVTNEGYSDSFDSTDKGESGGYIMPNRHITV